MLPNVKLEDDCYIIEVVKATPQFFDLESIADVIWMFFWAAEPFNVLMYLIS